MRIIQQPRSRYAPRHTAPGRAKPVLVARRRLRHALALTSSAILLTAALTAAAIVRPHTTISACPSGLTSAEGGLIAIEGCPGQAAPAVPPQPRAVVYSGPRFGFSGPSDIAAGAGRLWVSNVLGNSVTQLRADPGKWAATLPGGRYGFAGPEALAAGAGELWVANVQANSVIEINATTGR